MEEKSVMDKKRFAVQGKQVTLYVAKQDNKPLIVLNNYMGEGSSVVESLKQLGCTQFNLLCVSNLEWDHDMTPWDCPPLSPEDIPCTGGADEYLELLLSEILPKAKELLNGVPAHISIAGYSLAGLFALYAMYKCDNFSRVASMSGSLWFPDFKEYCMSHMIKRYPEKIYISLGDREAKTRNHFLKTVQDNTEKLVEYYRTLGMNVIWELNPGNHIKDAAMRTAKGILAIL